MDYNQNSYNETVYDYAVEPQKNTIGMVGMILGIVGFILNPLYLVSVAAIILSIIGVCKKDAKKGMAIAGIICGGVSMVCQIVFDFFITAFSAGLGVFFIFC